MIEEGLNGRTTVFDDPIEPDRRGADYLPPCLRSHAPLDLLIIALGCNDLKARFGVPPPTSRAAIERLIDIARAAKQSRRPAAPPAILIVAPPPLAKLTGFADMFAGGTEKSQRARRALRRGRGAARRRLRRRRPVHPLLGSRRHPFRSRPARDPRRRDGGGGADGAGG